MPALHYAQVAFCAHKRQMKKKCGISRVVPMASRGSTRFHLFMDPPLPSPLFSFQELIIMAFVDDMTCKCQKYLHQGAALVKIIMFACMQFTFSVLLHI